MIDSVKQTIINTYCVELDIWLSNFLNSSLEEKLSKILPLSNNKYIEYLLFNNIGFELSLINSNPMCYIADTWNECFDKLAKKLIFELKEKISKKIEDDIIDFIDDLLNI